MSSGQRGLLYGLVGFCVSQIFSNCMYNSWLNELDRRTTALQKVVVRLEDEKEAIVGSIKAIKSAKETGK